MKRSIIWAIALILTLLLSVLLFSCSSKDDVLRLEEYGYISLEGQIGVPGLSGKHDVPSCSEEVPVFIEYIFRDSKGLTWARQSAITIVDNIITLSEEVRLPVGEYAVEDISIISNSGLVTHKVPSMEATGFDFTSFVEFPLPYQIEIVAGEVSNTPAELICYSSQFLNLSGAFSGRTTIVDLETIYVRLPDEGCVDRITIESDGREIIDFGVSGRGFRGFPILADFDVMFVRAYQNGVLLTSVQIDEYLPGLEITEDEAVELGDICD